MTARITASAKRAAVRSILAGNACVRPAGVFDPLSALAAEDIGYELGMLGGSVASLAILGAPDIAVLTLSELAEQVRRICRVGNLPVMVDADHGYGNALNVRRTVEELENAGVSGLTLEDTLLPAAFGKGGAQLISVEEAVGKLRAALGARIDPSLVIVGRTHADLAGTGEELLRRQALYQAEGIDALFITGLKSLDHLDALAKAATVPLVLGGPFTGLDAAGLAARGVRICLQGHQSYFQAVKQTYLNLAALRNAEVPADFDAQELAKRLSQADRYKKWGNDFLS